MNINEAPFRIIPFVFYFIGIFCLITVALPDSWIMALLGSFTTDGSVNMPAERIMPTLKIALVLLALLLLSVGFMLQKFRSSIIRYITFYLESLRENVMSTATEMNQAIQSDSRLHLVVLALTIVAGFSLRLYYMSYSILYDEGYTYFNFVQMPLIVGLTDYSAPNNHLFYTLLSHISVSILGETTFALRLPAFIAGIMIVPASYIASRFVIDKNVAIITASFTATSYTLIDYTANARGYSLASLFFLCMIISSFRIAKANNLDTLNLTAQFFAIVGALYTLPSMIYAVLANFLFLFYIAFKKKLDFKLIKKLAALAIVSLATCAALYSVVFMHIPYNKWKNIPVIKTKITPLPFNTFVEKNSSEFKQAINDFLIVYPGYFGQVIIAFMLIGMIYVLYRHTMFSKFLIVLAFTAISLLLFQRIAPFSRSWQYLIPIAASLVSVGIIFIVNNFCRKKYIVEIALLAAVLNLMLAGPEAITTKADRHYFKESPLVGAMLKERYQEGDMIVTLGSVMVAGIISHYLYSYNVFGAREYDEYSTGAYLDHFKGKDTHMDMHRQYQATELSYVYNEGQADKLKKAKRIFFIIYLKTQEVGHILSYNPDDFTSPTLIMKLDDAEVFMSKKRIEINF